MRAVSTRFRFLSLFLALVAAGLWVAPSSGLAATIRVPADHPTIQAAIDAAASGDTVLVAPGEYLLSRPIVFRGKAVALESEDGPETTILRLGVPDDARRRSLVSFEGAEPPGAALEGFTLRGGQGRLVTVEFEAQSDPVVATAGGAVYCGPFSEPLLAGNIIADNVAQYGAGVFCDVDSRVTFRENLFRENRSTDAPRTRFPGGPGITCLSDSVIRVEGGAFVGNRSVVGGAIYLAADSRGEIEGVRFEGNFAHYHGGAIFCRGTELTVRRCEFLRNSTKGDVEYQPEVVGVGGSGGAIEIDAFSHVRFRMEECLLEENEAQIGGGLSVERIVDTGSSSAVVTDCRFLRNRGSRAGGAVYCEHESERLALRGCRIEGNSAPKGGGLYCAYGGETEVRDSVFFANYAVVGGAVCCEESNTAVYQSTIVGNAAGHDGGGVFVIDEDSRLILEDSILWDNAGGSLRGDLCGEGQVCYVSHNSIEGETVWPGEGNQNADPGLEAWGDRDEVWVDAGAPGPGPGSGTREDPWTDIAAALEGYGIALAEGSPAIGAGKGGADLGADPGSSVPRPAAAGSRRRLVHLAAGRYALPLGSLAAGVSIRGAGATESGGRFDAGADAGADAGGEPAVDDARGATAILGTIVGLRTGAVLSDLTVTGAATRGAIIVAAGEAPRIARAIVAGNAGDPGVFPPSTSGGITCHASSPTFESCLIAGNRRSGLRLLAGAAPRIVGSTVASHTAGARAIVCDGASPVIRSSIVWGGGTLPPIALVGESAPDIAYSAVEGETVWPGEGNIRDDPLFVAPGTWDGQGRWTGGDYRLGEGSPAIDAGDPLDGVAADLDGAARPCGPATDMGAFERCDLPPEPSPFRRGDGNADGALNLTDAVFLLDHLFRGASGPGCEESADTNADGRLDLSDAVYVLNYLFIGGEEPPAPFGACGRGAEPSGLTCLEFPPCA